MSAACDASNATRDDASAPLVLERSIALPGVRGRIDHLEWDPAGRRLFVAALGNNSVEVIDVAAGTRLGHIAGLHEPQGLAWLTGTQELAVASSDGTVKFYAGATLGLPKGSGLPIGIMELVILALYIWPRTALLGVVLVTALMGGTAATHLIAGNPWGDHILFGVYLALIAWGGLWFRDPALRALLPVRRA